MLSQTDINKRTEILNEFLYYVFDSLLIPLIRSNFYVTESSVYRSRLFFFRHDVWRCAAEPAMAALKAGMLEEVKPAEMARLTHHLGPGQIRLLPKEMGMRPIVNLKRRALVGVAGGNRKLGQSVNSMLGPVHSMLKLEGVSTWLPRGLDCPKR